jgi:hypothetical protein
MKNEAQQSCEELISYCFLLAEVQQLFQINVPFNGFLKTACLFLSFDLHCVAVALL